LNENIAFSEDDFIELDKDFKEISKLEKHKEISMKLMENMKNETEKNLENNIYSTYKNIEECAQKMQNIEQKVLQYKQKSKEVQEMRMKLSKINEEIKLKDTQISKAKTHLTEIKKRIIISSDSEQIANEFKKLVQKGIELQENLDFYIKHKDSLVDKYENLNDKKYICVVKPIKNSKLMEEKGQKLISALRNYRKKIMQINSTADESGGKNENINDFIDLQQVFFYTCEKNIEYRKIRRIIKI